MQRNLIWDSQFIRVNQAKRKDSIYAKSAEQPASHVQGPVVQSIVSLMSLLITNSSTAVAKVFSNTLTFLLQKCECKSYSHFSAKNINVFLPYVKIEILTSCCLKTLLSFGELSSDLFLFLYKNICYGYPARHFKWISRTYAFMEQ